MRIDISGLEIYLIVKKHLEEKFKRVEEVSFIQNESYYPSAIAYAYDDEKENNEV